MPRLQFSISQATLHLKPDTVGCSDWSLFEVDFLIATPETECANQSVKKGQKALYLIRMARLSFKRRDRWALTHILVNPMWAS